MENRIYESDFRGNGYLKRFYISLGYGMLVLCRKRGKTRRFFFIVPGKNHFKHLCKKGYVRIA